MERDAKLYQDLTKVLVTRDEIAKAVKELGARITKDYAGKAPVLIGILKGAVVFYSDLIREIDLPLTTEFMAISSYGSATKSSGVVQVLKDLNRDITGKDVMIVEDIVDSGMTLSYLKKYLADRGASSIKHCDAAGQARSSPCGADRGLFLLHDPRRVCGRLRSRLR